MNYAPISKCNGPLWEPKVWDDLNEIPHLKTNCYSYAFNYIDYGGSKLQPGELSSGEFKEYTCENIFQKMKEDYKGIQKSYFKEDLDCSRYQIALAIDTITGDDDFHFYRKDTNNYWSHKTGTNNVSMVDASGDLIINPEYCDRDYHKLDKDDHNYNLFCGYYSIPNKEGPIVRSIEQV
tara:strand:+ start:477 stop:1013 length:537 start_codon:yes stop_codon:yes gene_type:complete